MRDRLVTLWYRLTYCTRHGHYKVHEGVCLNCGSRVSPPGEGNDFNQRPLRAGPLDTTYGEMRAQAKDIVDIAWQTPVEKGLALSVLAIIEDFERHLDEG